MVSHWESYEQASEAFDQIEPYRTTEDDLEGLGYAAEETPNVQRLNHADIADRFMVHTLDSEHLPDGLRDCLENCQQCYGYEFREQVTNQRRYGNFAADFLRFKRKVEIRGWSFKATIVMVDGLVVYKLWGGTPRILKYEDEVNPLGPLQGVGPKLAPVPDL